MSLVVNKRRLADNAASAICCRRLVDKLPLVVPIGSGIHKISFGIFSRLRGARNGKYLGPGAYICPRTKMCWPCMKVAPCPRKRQNLLKGNPPDGSPSTSLKTTPVSSAVFLTITRDHVYRSVSAVSRDVFFAHLRFRQTHSAQFASTLAGLGTVLS